MGAFTVMSALVALVSVTNAQLDDLSNLFPQPGQFGGSNNNNATGNSAYCGAGTRNTCNLWAPTIPVQQPAQGSRCYGQGQLPTCNAPDSYFQDFMRCDASVDYCYEYNPKSPVGPQNWQMVHNLNRAADVPGCSGQNSFTKNAGYGNTRCCGGRYQSPIDLPAQPQMHQGLNTPQYRQPAQAVPGYFENTGTSATFRPNYGQGQQPAVAHNFPFTCARYNNSDYVFHRMNIHAGNKGHGSAHFVGGKPYDGEIHLVHAHRDFTAGNNVGYRCASQNPMGVAVIAIFLSTTEGQPNAELNRLLAPNNVNGIQNKAPRCNFNNINSGNNLGSIDRNDGRSMQDFMGWANRYFGSKVNLNCESIRPVSNPFNNQQNQQNQQNPSNLGNNPMYSSANTVRRPVGLNPNFNFMGGYSGQANMPQGSKTMGTNGQQYPQGWNNNQQQPWSGPNLTPNQQTNNQQRNMFNQQPNNQQRNMFNQQPNSFNQQPNMFNQQPNNANQLRNMLNQQPNNLNQQNNNLNQQRNMFNQQPKSFNQQNNIGNVHACDMPLHIGNCLASIPRYYWSNVNKKCTMFNYGGCQGNMNNFQSLEACMKTCANRQRTPVTPNNNMNNNMNNNQQCRPCGNQATNFGKGTNQPFNFGQNNNQAPVWPNQGSNFGQNNNQAPVWPNQGSNIGQNNNQAPVWPNQGSNFGQNNQANNFGQNQNQGVGRCCTSTVRTNCTWCPGVSTSFQQGQGQARCCTPQINTNCRQCPNVGGSRPMTCAGCPCRGKRDARLVAVLVPARQGCCPCRQQPQQPQQPQQCCQGSQTPARDNCRICNLGGSQQPLPCCRGDGTQALGSCRNCQLGGSQQPLPCCRGDGTQAPGSCRNCQPPQQMPCCAQQMPPQQMPSRCCTGGDDDDRNCQQCPKAMPMPCCDGTNAGYCQNCGQSAGQSRAQQFWWMLYQRMIQRQQQACLVRRRYLYELWARWKGVTGGEGNTCNAQQQTQQPSCNQQNGPSCNAGGPSMSVRPGMLMPQNNGCYNYLGSLPTPPCSEAVNWVVMKQPIRITPAQLALLRQLRSQNAGQLTSMYGDVRPLQPINGRPVLCNA